MTAKHHHQGRQATPTRPPHPRPPWWKRRTRWLAGVIVSLVTGLVLTWLVWIAGPPQHATAPPSNGSNAAQLGGLPILVNVYHEGAQTNPVNGAFAFPQLLSLSKADLRYIDTRGVTAWAVARGGYDIAQTTVKLTITARRRVRILGMRAMILARSAPVTGTLLEPAEQGAVLNTAIDIGLASISPIALLVGSDGFPTSQPYFKKYSYVLAPNEQATFEITAFPGHQLYQLGGGAFRWLLDVTILDQNHLRDVLVRDSGGKPFGTTGPTPNTAAFRALYEQCLYPEIKVAACQNIPRTQWTRK
jgi:hypothetical protein